MKKSKESRTAQEKRLRAEFSLHIVVPLSVLGKSFPFIETLQDGMPDVNSMRLDKRRLKKGNAATGCRLSFIYWPE
ncbi:MAG: hypothetical protein K9L59_02865 [Desulfobacterales bacterium]|nr:hypothetical protein [Desulfobacterales bacterium]